jgi:hypothetical protein
MTPTKNEILGLERKYWNAMKSNDVDTAISLTKFPCAMASPKGFQKVSEEQYRKIMDSMKGDQYKDVEIQEPHVEILNNNTAMIAYSVEMKGIKMMDVSTWVRDGEKWVCAFHSENPVN